MDITSIGEPRNLYERTKICVDLYTSQPHNIEEKD